MHLTCPSCSAKFKVPDKALGTEGRNVRCGKCGHVWFQEPILDPETSPESTSSFELRATEGAQEPDTPLTEPALQMTDSLSAAAESPKEPGRGWGMAVGWGLLFVIVVGLVAAAIAYRQAIIDYLPADAKRKAADVYDALGLPFDLPGYGLKIEVTQSSRQSENGVPVLVIEGKITNVSGKARQLPRLRAALRDDHKHELQHWYFSVKEQQILSGQSVGFRTSIDDPAPEAKEAAITFVPSQ